MSNEQPTLAEVSTQDLMIDDLANQVARKSVEVSQWKARALKAEDALREIKEAADAETPDAEVKEDGAEEEEAEE